MVKQAMQPEHGSYFIMISKKQKDMKKKIFITMFIIAATISVLYVKKLELDEIELLDQS